MSRLESIQLGLGLILWAMFGRAGEQPKIPRRPLVPFYQDGRGAIVFCAESLNPGQVVRIRCTGSYTCEVLN